MLDLYEELKTLIHRLQEVGIDYALCGGLALALYGIPRATVDIDILVQKESLGKAQKLARELGYIVKGNPMEFARGAIAIHRLSKKDEETADWVSLNFLVVTPPIKEAWGTRWQIEWEEGRIWVVSREGLIFLKSLRASGQDLDDVKKSKGRR